MIDDVGGHNTAGSIGHHFYLYANGALIRDMPFQCNGSPSNSQILNEYCSASTLRRILTGRRIPWVRRPPSIQKGSVYGQTIKVGVDVG
jgi:hypothetical protein